MTCPAASSAHTAFCCRPQPLPHSRSCAYKAPPDGPQTTVHKLAQARLGFELGPVTPWPASSPHFRAAPRVPGPLTAARTWSWAGAGLEVENPWSQLTGEGMEPQPPAGSCPPSRVPSPGLMWAPRPDVTLIGACPSGSSSIHPSPKLPGPWGQPAGWRGFPCCTR